MPGDKLNINDNIREIKKLEKQREKTLAKKLDVVIKDETKNTKEIIKYNKKLEKINEKYIKYQDIITEKSRAQMTQEIGRNPFLNDKELHNQKKTIENINDALAGNIIQTKQNIQNKIDDNKQKINDIKTGYTDYFMNEQGLDSNYVNLARSEGGIQKTEFSMGVDINKNPFGDKYTDTKQANIGINKQYIRPNTTINTLGFTIGVGKQRTVSPTIHPSIGEIGQKGLTNEGSPSSDEGGLHEKVGEEIGDNASTVGVSDNPSTEGQGQGQSKVEDDTSITLNPNIYANPEVIFNKQIPIKNGLNLNVGGRVGGTINSNLKINTYGAGTLGIEKKGRGAEAIGGAKINIAGYANNVPTIVPYTGLQLYKNIKDVKLYLGGNISSQNKGLTLGATYNF